MVNRNYRQFLMCFFVMLFFFSAGWITGASVENLVQRNNYDTIKRVIKNERIKIATNVLRANSDAYMLHSRDKLQQDSAYFRTLLDFEAFIDSLAKK